MNIADSVKLEELRRRAGAVGCHVKSDQKPNEEIGAMSGPYALARTEMGYAHVAGVSLAALQAQIEEIERESKPEDVPCPFVYAKGRKCKGHIVRIEAFKADLQWTLGDDGTWSFNIGQPRSHYHLYCSEKGNHAGYSRPDAEAMKFYYDKLPQALRAMLR